MERTLLTFFILIISSSRVYAYGIISHQHIAIQTLSITNTHIQFDQSGATGLETFYSKNLGIKLTSPFSFLAKTKTGQQWIAQGSQDEDSTEQFYRPINHFFDPQHGDSLWEGMNRRYGLKFPQTAFEATFGVSNKATDWALEDYSEYDRQAYSLKDANDALYKALTTTYTGQWQGNRDWYIGKYFYAIGHVLHLLADMGQPEHVRIDQHLVFGDPEPIWVDRYLLKFYSLYEQYTEKESRRLMRDLPVLASKTSTPYPYQPTDIKKARDLWIDRWSSITSEKGLSVFTNNNFVSNDSNFDTDYYQSPIRNAGESCRPLSQLMESGTTAPIDPRVGELSGDVCFVSNNITDRNQNNLLAANDRAASLSIFNAEVELYHDDCLTISYAEFDSSQPAINGCKKYTMNRWNFDSAHGFLMPRIVGYGSALLEHLYRGRMEILPPTQADASDFRIAPLEGVSQLPLMVSNATPNETMGQGKLVAVVTYVDSNNEVVEAITSEEITGATPSNNSEPFTFKFTNRSFPLNMAGLTAYIQVIFRGQLGDEKDNIVVARKPLSDIVIPITLTGGLPDNGTYALVNHLPGSQGFGKMKLKLSSGKPLDGTIRPIAMHHLNNCYRDDLTGEYNVEGQTRICSGADYHSDETYYKAAYEINGSNITAEPQEFDVNFQTPVPFNATDLQLTLYHYPADSYAPVGVSFVDISEPTFISFINSTDYTSFESEYKSYQELEEILTTESDLIPRIKPAETEVEILFGTSNIVSAKIERLPIAQYSRIAILTEEKEFSLTYNVKRLDVTNTNPTSNQAWYPATVNQDVTLADGSKAHQYPSFTKLRNVISNINILLEYKPILPLPDTADTSTLPDAVPSNGAVVIY